MGKLSGKTAIITGASSGFGRGTAYEFAKEGCNLVLTARREERLKETIEKCKKLGANAIYVVGDAREELTAIRTVNAALEVYGKIDILINNAGIGRVQKIEETTMEDYDLIMDSNVKSAFSFTKNTVPTMLKQSDGQIIMVSSVTGIKGHTDEAAYTCSKFALRGFAQALDQELLSRGIKTCVFCPHAGATEFEVGFGRTEEQVENSGHLTPEDVGRALLSVCTQTENSRIVELRLASNNVKY